MNPELLVIGDCTVDQYMEVDSPQLFHDPHTKEAVLCFMHGSKIPIKSLHHSLAGNATHVSVAAQKLGLKTSLYTELGDDEQSKEFLDRFKKEGIDTKYCKRNSNSNTNIGSIILYETDRTIFSYHAPRKYELPFSKMKKPSWIYYTSMGEGFEKFQKDLLKYIDENPDIVLAFNPGTMQLKDGPEKLKAVLKKTKILFVNRNEACRLINLGQWSDIQSQKLHESLHKLGPQLTLITDGKNGSSAFDGSEFIELPSPEIKGKVVDKTGAGDSYAAAFLAALHYKKPLREAMAWGNKNAASVVASFGCIDSVLSLEDMHD
jgi:sugar/nucleoside kinase (ribokinase family)